MIFEEYKEPSYEEKVARLLELLGLPLNSEQANIIQAIEEFEKASQEINLLAYQAGGPANLGVLTGWLEKIRTMDSIDARETWLLISDYKKANRLPPWNE